MRHILAPGLIAVCVIALALAAPLCAQFPRPTGSNAATEAAGQLMRDWLAQTAPEELQVLEGARASEVTIIKGSMDHLEDVLGAAHIPFELVDPRQVDPRPFDAAHRIVMISCPGRFIDPEAEKELAAFVRRGGWLMTTDWALGVVQRQFPGYVKWSGQSTGDEVVNVQQYDPLHPLLKGVMGENSAARWWLEGGSYPIQILKPDQVRVLVHSPEMKERYGFEAVAIHFEFGLGTVFHMTSHMYLQRGDRSGVSETAETYIRTCLAGKEVSAAAAERVIPLVGSVSRGELESAYTTAKFIARIIIENRSRE